MNILKRILAKARKFAFRKKPFNLRKDAKNVGVEDANSGFLTAEEMQLLTDVILSLSPEKMEDFKNGKLRIDINAPVDAPVDTSIDTSTLTPNDKAIIEELLKDRNLIATLITYKNDSIRDLGEAEKSKEKAIDYLQIYKGLGEFDAKRFVDVLLDMSEGALGEPTTEKAEEKERKILDIGDPGFLVNKLMTAEKGEIYSYMQSKMDEQLGNIGMIDPGTLLEKLLETNLMPPKINANLAEGSNILNTDPRAAYFFNNPEDFPIDKFKNDPNNPKVQLLRDLLTKHGFDPGADWMKVVLPSVYKMKGIKAEFSNKLMEIAGSEIIETLAKKIDSDPKRIADWVMRASKNVRDSFLRDSKEFTNVGTPEPGEYAPWSNYQSSILEPGEELEIREEAEELGVDPEQALAEETEQRDRFKTKKEEKGRQIQIRETDRENFQPLIQMFVNHYLQEVLKETKKLGQDVAHGLLEGRGLKRSNAKKMNDEDLAEKLLIYMNTAVEQIDKFFNIDRNIEDKFQLNFDTKTNEEVFTYRHPLDKDYKITIPKKALIDLREKLQSVTGKQFYEHIEHGQPTSEASGIVREIARTSAKQWQPEWNTWVRPNELNNMLQGIGETKVNIKRQYDMNPQAQPTDIYKNLSETDRYRLNDASLSYNDILGLIDRVKYRDVEAPSSGRDRSIYSNWLYAGQPGVPSQLKGNERVEFLKNKMNDPNLSPEEREKWGHISRASSVIKQQLTTNIVHTIPILESIFKEGRYGQPAFKAFFDVLPMLKKYRTGEETLEAEMTGRATKGKNYFERIYDLTGYLGDLAPLEALRLQSMPGYKERAMEEIKNSEEVEGDSSIAINLANKEAEFDSIGKVIELAKKYKDIVKDYHQLDKLIDDQKIEIAKAEKKSKNVIQNTISKRDFGGRPIPRNMADSYRWEWTNEDGSIKMIDPEQEKRKKIAEEKIEKYIKVKKKRDENPKRDAKSRRGIIKEIEVFKESNMHYKNNELMQKALKSLNVTASSNNIKMIYAMYKRDAIVINQLFGMAKKNSSMKLASNYNVVDEMIDVIIDKYKNILGL